MSISKITTNLETLKINYLTQSMYDEALLNSQIMSNELYMTPYSTNSIETIYTIDDIATGNIIGSINLSVSAIAQYLFASCRMSVINLSECTYIAEDAFQYCSWLRFVNIPECSVIGTSAFWGCRNLVSINMPKCIEIKDYAFAYCWLISAASSPVCTTISSYAFTNCSNLTTVNFPVCTTIRNNAFNSCNLISISLPACTSIGSSAFANCYNLISLDLSMVSSVPTLGNYAFFSTPISNYSTSAGQYGSVYVPSSLYNSFIIASNWSLISSRIVSV